MVTGSSHSISMCPPHSPTPITKKSILKLSGAFHCPKTSRIRFCAFSYSMGEPCGRSNQLITYFMGFLQIKGGNVQQLPVHQNEERRDAAGRRDTAGPMTTED